MQGKMMAYDHVITDLNNARLRGTSFPIMHALLEASFSLSPDVRFLSPSPHPNAGSIIFPSSRSSYKLLRVSIFSPKLLLNPQPTHPTNTQVHIS
jgi:hypothetical protein